MQRGVYRLNKNRPRKTSRKITILVVMVILLGIGFVAYKQLSSSPAERSIGQLKFDTSATEAEKQTIFDAIKNQSKTLNDTLSAKVVTSTEQKHSSAVLSAYVPVTNVYSSKQATTKAELAQTSVFVPSNMDNITRVAIASSLGLDTSKIATLSGSTNDISDTSVVFIPVNNLSQNVKLLSFEGNYYLDSFQKGAIFRQAEFIGHSATGVSDLQLNHLAKKDTILKVNMTGVTALTRLMVKKLDTTKDPTYFSAKIGGFLADADITHISNEVSFKAGCQYSDTVFCTPPETIETLKASGVDLVELTGNHNNDVGSQYNTESINTYHGQGWGTFGGGLNTAEAMKPYVTDKKQSRIAFLGYNYADSPNGSPISGESKAGANSFNLDKVKSNIEAARQQSKFVIVDVQFAECYAYPDGFVEIPKCDLPIPNQKDVFRQIADFGADMVIGTQAHQPQIYEMYKDKPIYYGLGNLYFDQTQWPGTERGLILTHYFSEGKLLQTKLSPTTYDKDLQTYLMQNNEAEKFLERLKVAHEASNL